MPIAHPAYADATTSPNSKAASEPAVPANGVIGLVLTSRYPAIYETPGGKEECPNGFQHTHTETSRAVPTDADRTAQQLRYGYYTNRGPNGENVFYNPTAVEDPLPWEGIGDQDRLWADLDNKIGPTISRAPTGDPGIDNQMYRVLGCLAGVRAKGTAYEIPNAEIREQQYNRILLEITGVDSLVNDDQVQSPYIAGWIR